jgi:hypothetical protein
MAKKTTCPISREQFRGKAAPVKVVIDGVELEAPVKEFSTGSLGWYLNTKIPLDVGGVKVQVQVGLNLTIVGSKELPGGAEPAEAPEVAEPVASPDHPTP